MPGVQCLVEPAAAAAGGAPCSDEARQLDLALRRRLEEDVARLFDESIHSDYELVCGRAKILTHTCILKARTKRVYEKLKSVLNQNISCNAYDEIYSFISDVYTECDIQNQEKEILALLDRVTDTATKKANLSNRLNVDAKATPRPYSLNNIEPEVFLTPIGTTPYSDNRRIGIVSSSPSIELNKNYYALVDTSLLEKELKEQDVISKAFKYLNQSQIEEKKGRKSIKPTSLPLRSSHSSKTENSNECDFSNKPNINNKAIKCEKRVIGKPSSQNLNNCLFEADYKNTEVVNQEDINYSPDSLTADDPSSSSDYLSAAYSYPGPGCSSSIPQLDAKRLKMDSMASSDSGLDTNGLLESLNGGKDVTVTDTSLTESTLHDLITDDPSSSSLVPDNQVQRFKCDISKTTSQSGPSGIQDELKHRSPRNTSNVLRSSKDEKQRQNEEIVILESSSLSSETGSWEPVFPPKYGDKEATGAFLDSERHQYNETQQPTKNTTIPRKNKIPYKDVCPNLVQKSPLNITSFLFDASSLADEKEVTRITNYTLRSQNYTIQAQDVLPEPSRPVPCSSAKDHDMSPNEWSEGHDNDDSLDLNDSDSVQKDLSPTIFLISPTTEDYKTTIEEQIEDVSTSPQTVQSTDFNLRKHPLFSKTGFVTSTPCNSFMFLQASKVKGASAEEHLQQVSSNVSSPLARRKIENVPTVSGAHAHQDASKKSPQAAGSKSRSSVQSDCSEKSSQKFYIDLATLLPDPLPAKSDDTAKSVNQKKNIFSMYFDLGESTVKDKPARLSSSFTGKIRKREMLDASKGNTTAQFEELEALCENPTLSISEIIALPKKPGPRSKPDTNKETKQETSVETKIHKNNEKCMDIFVRLSDLDKPKLNNPATVIDKHTVLDVRMTRSIPDRGWDQVHPTRSSEVISSFHSENSLSLNRLFPHLKNEFSRSMPGSLTRSPLRTRSSNGETDQDSDLSEVTSVQSSCCRSIAENSTSEDRQTSSLIGNCQSKLGQDLLRMFLEEIAPDVVVEVSGRRFRAHKCILSSRCQYFAAILSGGWVQSAGNVIVLPSFSYNVVHFALCHIYSGASAIPDAINIVELTTIADMLSLEGLKEAIMFTMKTKYCHHFHKPCNVCTAGVLECFPLTTMYGLDDLSRKCLKWITKHFHKVWPTKAFATLPKQLLDRCYQEHIVNMSVDNLADTLGGCGIAMASLQSSRWADCVTRMCRRLLAAAAHFASVRLLAAVRAVGASPADLPPPAARAIHDCLAAAMESAPSDDAFRTYDFLTQAVKQICSYQNPKPDLVTNGDIINKHSLLWANANAWRLQCENSIVRSASPAVLGQAFETLPEELKRRLAEQGCIMSAARVMTTENKVQKTQHRQVKPSARANRRVDLEHVRASLVPYTIKPRLQTGSTDVASGKRKMPSIPLIRTTKAQEERARYKQAQKTQSQERLTARNLARPNKFDKIKPRYLEQKADKKTAFNRLAGTMVSSSESSCNSNPIQARNRKSKPANPGSQSISQDSLATTSRPCTAEPSTESLTESLASNKYATYTKKRTQGSSVECVKITHCPVMPQPSKTGAMTKIPVYINRAHMNHKKRVANETKAQTQPTTSSQPRPTTSAQSRPTTNAGTMVSSSESSCNFNPIQARNRKSKPANPGSQAISQDSLATTSRPCTAEPSTESLTESLASNKYATYTKEMRTQGSSVECVKITHCPVMPQPSKTGAMTKIPVYINRAHMNHKKRVANETKAQTPPTTSSQPRPTTSSQPRPTTSAQSRPTTNGKVSCSLMMATKSSSAKMVPKINKDTSTKPAAKQKDKKDKDDPSLPEIPIMDRSGTFLKDEPTFGDKTKNMNIE